MTDEQAAELKREVALLRKTLRVGLGLIVSELFAMNEHYERQLGRGAGKPRSAPQIPEGE